MPITYQKKKENLFPGVVEFAKKRKIPLLIALLLVVTLPFTYRLGQRAVELITGATFIPANLVVATDQPARPIRPIWRGVSQGHEMADQSLSTAVPYLKRINTTYVRIDHIYDGYDVVSRQDGRLVYNWAKLDQAVSEIVSAGALPYFSLSYMPSAISKSDILDVPKSWGEWGQVVAATVGHYSRDYHGGMSNVIYEVWNEPDLFGSWKMYGDKNYTTLYSTASNAAVGVKGTKSFKIGGPATTGLYTAWIDGFYKKLDSSVRIDFFSWHRYAADLETFISDAQIARDQIAPQISRSQDLYISEWGVNPERGSGYDTRWGAAHLLAVFSVLEDTAVDMAMPFEVQDGVQGDKQFHGGWGMLTNPKYGTVVPKPRFTALEMLNTLKGNKLAVSGQGEFVRGLAAVDETGAIRVMAVNYDKAGKHQEVFPLTLTGLSDVSYRISERYLSGRTTTNELVPQGGIIRRDVVLSPSDAVVVTVTRK
jgi:hypothetical protein